MNNYVVSRKSGKFILCLLSFVFFIFGALAAEAAIELELGDKNTIEFNMYMPQRYYETRKEILDDGKTIRYVKKTIHAPQEVALGKDEVYVKVNLTSPSRLYFNVSTNSSMKTLVSVDLLKSDRKTVISHERNYAYGEWMPCFDEYLPAGVYYVHLYEFYDYDCLGEGQFKVYFSVSGGITDDDASSANNTKETATELTCGKTVSGYIDTMGKDTDDWYKISVPSDGAALKVNQGDSVADMELMDNDGSKIATGQDLGSDPYKLKSGTYYLHISSSLSDLVVDDGLREFSSRSGGPYSLQLDYVITAIKLDKTELQLQDWQRYTLTASFVPDNSLSGVMEWKSSNEQVVTIPHTINNTKSPYLEAVSAGKAVVTGTLKGTSLSVQCNVTVSAPVSKESGVSSKPTSSNTIIQNNFYVKLEKTKLSLNPGDSTYLSYRYAAPCAVIFKSSNNKIVSADGWKITAKKPGTAKITASLKDYPSIKAVCKVTVKKPKLKLSKKQVSLKKKKTYKISTKISPTPAKNPKFTYKSSNAKIAKVSKKGVVTALKKGTCTITVQTKLYGVKLTAKLKVKVKA